MISSKQEALAPQVSPSTASTHTRVLFAARRRLGPATPQEPRRSIAKHKAQCARPKEPKIEYKSLIRKMVYRKPSKDRPANVKEIYAKLHPYSSTSFIYNDSAPKTPLFLRLAVVAVPALSALLPPRSETHCSLVGRLTLVAV